jgi:hypothetical protein
MKSKMHFTLFEIATLNYVWGRVIRGFDYVCLVKMSKALGFRYDLCETLVVKLQAEGRIPRLSIVEEVEG